MDQNGLPQVLANIPSGTEQGSSVQVSLSNESAVSSTQSPESPNSEAGNLVSSTSDRSSRIVNEQNGLKSEEDGLYFTFPENGGVDALIAALDSVFKEGTVIKDFEYATVMDVLLGKADFPEGRFRVGGERVPMDAEKLPAFDRAIIGGEREGYFEFLVGAPVPSDRDEFIAALWKGGIRCGIDTGSLESTLAEGSKKPGKYLVARAVLAVEGSDAKPLPRAQLQPQKAIKEPGENGRADLHIYECTFPKVPSGPGPHPLLEKIPAIPGKSGRSVDGKILAPRQTKDFDLTRTVGVGTYVTQIDGKNIVVTDLSGQYIEVDPKGKISVSPHAKNSFPIGPKTWSLEVEIERFEQVGDIEHQYELIGQNIEIAGNVRGKVLSKSGNVRLVGNIENGGVIDVKNGNATVEGKVFGGRVVALGGKITASKAEGSVFIAREVEITHSAVNCFVIADVIHIKKAAWTSFFAQNVTIDHLDITDSSFNPVTGFIAIRVNAKARKTIRRFEKRQRRLEKVKQIESLVCEQWLAEAWAELDSRMSNKEPLSPEESHRFGPLIQPYEYVRRRKGMLARDQAFFADPKNSTEYATALESVEAHERIMNETIGLSVGSVSYPPEFLAILSEKAVSDPSAVLVAAPQKFCAYVSSDPSIAELSKYEERLQKFFLAFVSRMLADAVVNESRIRPLRSLSLLRAPCKQGYEALKILSDADRLDTDIVEGRRNDSASIEIGNELVIPVMVDGYSIGRMRNVSDHGMSILFDDTQENPPVFEKLEEVQVAFKLGNTEHRYPLAITTVVENDNAGFVKITGYYVHANEDVLNKTRRLRTEIETMLAKRRGRGI